MSARNTLENKQMRRLTRALRKGRLPVHVDLVVWLQDHGYAQTAGSARELLKDGRVRADSHPLGVIDIYGEKIVMPIVPASVRDAIIVS